jgi:hypothetical protein
VKTIWKQTVRPNAARGDFYPIELKATEGSFPLAVMVQNGKVCVWYEVDDERPGAILHVYCVGTGYGFWPPHTEHFASVVDGEYVWHFYRWPKKD